MARKRRLGLEKGLVVAQVAVSLVLLVGAGLYIRTLENLENQDLGFNQRRLLLFGINPAQNGYKGQRLLDLYGRLLGRLQNIPGVRSATMSSAVPVSGSRFSSTIAIEGYTPQIGQNMDVDCDVVGPSFFGTIGIRLLLGRGVEWQDTAGSPAVAVVNQAFARSFFQGRNPIGHRFSIDWHPSTRIYGIVGVAQDAKLTGLQSAPQPAAYIPYSQAPIGQTPFLPAQLHFEVRTVEYPMALVPTVRRLVRNLAPDLPLSDVKTQTEQISETLLQERLFARLSGLFGALALLLAMAGLYGLMAYGVARRTYEIGIRMALGAKKSHVLRLVVGEGMALALIGVGIGVAGAIGLTRFLSSMLYDVRPTDPLTFALVSLILTGVALLACYIPARRAAKVDPMVALRHE